jgi:hypothetical protein
MDQADFPWQQLGSLLLDEGLLSKEELERSLAEQRRTGQKLGQILVGQGAMTGTELARALARQHGVELRSRSQEEDWEDGPEVTFERVDAPWRPLGVVLLDGELVTEDQLEEALAEKRVHQDRRLGAILVRLGYISGVTLALALAEQHGIGLDTAGVPDSVRTVTIPVPPGQPGYLVYAAAFAGDRRSRKVLYEGPNFLDAADWASEYIDRENPEAVEIERLDGDERETVWSYSRERADAEAEAGKPLVETFGFDPARWDFRA